jgi:hypothetical protein
MFTFTAIVILLAVVIYKRLERKSQASHDGLGPVIGTATEYDRCPLCTRANSQYPRGRGEVITRGGQYVVRQYHICGNCGGRALWHRRLDLFVWTINRNGVVES